MSWHRTEAERLLDLVDTSNLPPGDLATVILCHAVLAVDDSITDGTTALVAAAEAAAERLAEAIPIVG
jgi:hypothetical protein